MTTVIVPTLSTRQRFATLPLAASTTSVSSAAVQYLSSHPGISSTALSFLGSVIASASGSSAYGATGATGPQGASSTTSQSTSGPTLALQYANGSGVGNSVVGATGLLYVSPTSLYLGGGSTVGATGSLLSGAGSVLTLQGGGTGASGSWLQINGSSSRVATARTVLDDGTGHPNIGGRLSGPVATLTNTLTTPTIGSSSLTTGFLTVNSLALSKMVQCVGTCTAAGQGSMIFGSPIFTVGVFTVVPFGTGLTFPANHSATTRYLVRVAGVGLSATGSAQVVLGGSATGTAPTLTVLSLGTSASTTCNTSASLFVSVPVNTVYTLTAVSTFDSFTGSVSVIQMAV